AVWLSAQDGRGLDLLYQALTECLAEDIIDTALTLAPEKGRLRAGLHELGAVREEHFDDEGHVCLQIRLPRRDFYQLMSRLDERAEDYLPGSFDEHSEQEA